MELHYRHLVLGAKAPDEFACRIAKRRQLAYDRARGVEQKDHVDGNPGYIKAGDILALAFLRYDEFFFGEIGRLMPVWIGDGNVEQDFFGPQLDRVIPGLLLGRRRQAPPALPEPGIPGHSRAKRNQYNRYQDDWEETPEGAHNRYNSRPQ